MKSNTKKHLGGRPRKFNENSRPITLTLPERILSILERVDPDRAKAIAKVAEMAEEKRPGKKGVEIVDIEPGAGIIIVGSSKVLRKIPGLKLIEIGPARYMISVPTGLPFETIEVALMDEIEDLPAEDVYERDLLTELKSHFNKLRRFKKLSKAEIIFVDTKKDNT